MTKADADAEAKRMDAEAKARGGPRADQAHKKGQDVVMGELHQRMRSGRCFERSAAWKYPSPARSRPTRDPVRAATARTTARLRHERMTSTCRPGSESEAGQAARLRRQGHERRAWLDAVDVPRWWSL
jgi:hypothetical protein